MRATATHPPARIDAVTTADTIHGRRLATASRTVAILFVALVLGALLDARGLRKTAAVQSPGLRKDVAVAVTERLVAVSSATRLDLLRAGAKDAIGRGGDDRVATTIALPEPATEAAPKPQPVPARPQDPTGQKARPAQPAEPALPTYTAARPLSVWAAGDSLVIEPAYAVERATSRLPVRMRPVEGRVATGLERPDVYDWFARVREIAPSLRGGVAVLCFGGNDDHAYMTALPEGLRIPSFWSEEWRTEYGRRVGGVMDILAAHGVHVVWIGLPMTRNESQTERWAQLNAVVRREAAQRPDSVAYVDTYWLLSDRGQYAEYRRSNEGTLLHLRQPDGVHFRPAAADMVAEAVLSVIRKHVRFEGGN